MEFKSSGDQTNFMGYYPPSPIDYSNGGWEYHKEITDPEHSNPWRYASEPQDEQENHMEYFPPPQNDSSHYSNAPNVSYSINQEPSSFEQSFISFMQNCPPSPSNFSFENSSSLDYASTQSFFQNPYNSFHQPQNSFHNSKNSLHTPQNNFTTTHPCSQNYSKPSSLELVEDLYQKSREFLERQEQS
ncbi:hypothetical protein AHAS_Ahas15G0211200 [Arachis hypogaea]